MKKLLTICLIFLAACSPQVPSEEPAATSAPAESPPTQPATAAPVEAYPATTAVPLPEAYPAPPVEEAAPANPYPANDDPSTAWVIRPEGIQCEEAAGPTGEKGLQNAVETLAAAGIAATEWELTEMMVTASCGSPTSTHYRVQISSVELEKAISLGWTPE